MRKTFIATMLLAGLALAGCGSETAGTTVASISKSSGKPAASASPTGSADPQEQGRKFAQCMRDHGVEMQDPDPNGGGGMVMTGKQGDKDKIKKAADACRAYSPFGERGEARPEDVERLRVFAQCIRDNGVDMPDPDANGQMVGGNADLKPDDPKMKAAIEACRDKMPMPGGTQ
ncbi:hypothetical protein [Microtetraspora malaysiensis]|uniref:hypothetical protein n=1 Tax=Microtetraspora malaysiensis TaxID=161358 RepID=UPI003D8CF26E